MRRLLQRLRRRLHAVIHRDDVLSAPSEVQTGGMSPPVPEGEVQAPPPDPGPAPPIAVACGVLRRTVRALCPPVDRLEEGERQRLGGLIFFGAVHFVSRMSEILKERPDLSPDPARIHAAGLAERQRRATRWAMVHGALSELAELANDCYLHEQGSAVEEAQQVINAYDLALAQALMRGEPDPKLVEDGLPIARVRVVLRRGQKRQHERRQRGERRLKEAAGRKDQKEKQEKKEKKGRVKRAEAGPLLDIQEWGRRAQGRG